MEELQMTVCHIEWMNKAPNLLDTQCRVKILRCKDPQMWYSDRIGQLVPIESLDLDGMWAREGGIYNALNIIRPEDVLP